MAKFDKMIKDGKIKRVGILRKEESKAIENVKAEAVDVYVPNEEEDYSAYMDVAHFEADALAKV